MAFDQNSIPKDLRPINIARTPPEDSRIVDNTRSVRSPKIYANTEESVPLFYPTSVQGNHGVGYGQWGTIVNVPIGNMGMSVNPAVRRFGYSPSFVNRVVGNGVDHVNTDTAAVIGSSPTAPNWMSSELTSVSGFVSSPSVGKVVSGSGTDFRSEEGGEESVLGRKVKFLCSFGGKILPRPTDGVLRYVGGQTRIISVRKGVSFNELMQKMVDIYGQPVVIKYQLPGEDLDVLASVSCPEDLDNMMEEYDKFVEKSPDGSAKLRVFLFSASELDGSGLVQFGDLHDGGQKYLDAVNGVTDVLGNGIARKESIASAASTQNSDFSGNEAVDNSGPIHVDTVGYPSMSMISSGGHVLATSHDSALKVASDSTSPVYTDASVVSMPKSVPIQNHPEVQYETSVPISLPNQQLSYDHQSGGISVPPIAPQSHAYMDHHHQAIGDLIDFAHLPPQVGFPNAHLLGTSGPSFSQQQIYENNTGLTHHQYAPAVQMTLTPPPSHVTMRPNMVLTLIQPQQTQLDNYSGERAFGTRMVQLPVEQSYNVYMSQAPPPALGGGYGWYPVTQLEHASQQVAFADKITRVEDCHMCQKAVPRVHSDSLVQDQLESGISSLSNSNSVHQSLLLEDSGKGNLNQGVGPHSTAIKPVIYQVQIAQLEGTLVSKNLENCGQPRLSVPTSMIGLPGVVQSHFGMVPGVVPQSYQEDSGQLHSIAMPYVVNQDISENKPLNSDISQFSGVSIQASEPVIHESPKAYSDKLSHASSKEALNETSTSHDQLKPVEGMLESLMLNHPETDVNKEHQRLTMDKMRLEEMAECGNQQIANFHGSRPLESYEAAGSPAMDNQLAYSQSKFGVLLLDSRESGYGCPPFSGVEQSYVADKIPTTVEWGNHNSHIQPSGLNEVETFSSNVIISSSLSPSKVEFQEPSNSLFSNQDPWNLNHDSHFPPPRPSKLLAKKDFSSKDAYYENHLCTIGDSTKSMMLQDNATNLEFANSSKGLAEDTIKQELKTVAEAVASSVFLSVTPNSQPPVHEQNKSPDGGSTGVIDMDVEMHHRAKFEDAKNKVQNQMSFGLRLSQDIGHLQIIKNNDLEELRELGSGTFGTVYHGKWRGTDVAIKRINDRCFTGKPSEQERMIDDFWNEAIKLADLHHPNVVAFYGVVLDGPDGSVATVTEFMVNGSLRNALQKNERGLDKRKRLMIAMDVAFGMEYLHGKNIVHFDLKSDNLLVNLRDPHRPICKVGDLGLSKVKCHTLISGGVRGTLPWMAPELLSGGNSLVSEKVDVFSYGIVLWELLTGEEPYADLHYGVIIGGIVSNTLRPPVPESCDRDWRSLMERCWSSEPSERPNFTEIVNELRAMAAKIHPKGQTNQTQQPPSAQPKCQNDRPST